MSISTDLTIKFGGEGNIKIETLTNFLEEYQKLLYLINTELGYSESDLELEVSPPEVSSFKIKILPKYKEQIFKDLGSLIVTVLGGIVLYHYTKSENPEKANQFITTNENGKLINKIYNSDNGKQIVNQTFVLVNNDENITGFELDKNGQEIVNIDKKDINKVVEDNNEIDNIDEIEETSSDILTDKQILILKTVHFEGQAKWAFIFKGYPIKVQINDTEFLKELNNRSFKKGDILTVLLSRKRTFDPDLKTFIVNQNSYKIEKVLKHEHNAGNSTGQLDF